MDRLQRMRERTFVLIKPDAVKRGLVGLITHRFEQTGLKIVASKMVLPTRELIEGHFPSDEEWVKGMGMKTLGSCEENGIDPTETFETSDPLEIGFQIKDWGYDYLLSGPVFAMVLEGIGAVNVVRKLVGNTFPAKAAPGTIRGDFSIVAADLATMVGAAVRNVVHASGTIEEAKQETANWFEANEILSYERTGEFIHFVQGRFTKGEEL